MGSDLLTVNPLAPNFSSVFLEVHLKCRTLGTVSMTVFYSFAHNTHQIVGSSKIVNLSEVLDSEELEVQVFMSEFSLHSGVLHYMANNFQKLYKRDYQDHIYSPGGQLKTRTLFSVPFATIYQMLMSNLFRIEDENSVLGFVFHYT